MATIAYLGTAKSSSNLSSYTHGVAFGDAASDRKIIVMGASRDTDDWDLSSVVIGGVTATLIRDNGAVGAYKEIWCAVADVPTGTSGNVVVNYGGQMSDNFIFVYRATGLVSNTATDYLSTNGNPSTGTLDVMRGGVIVGLEISDLYNTGSATWTGLTEDADVSNGGGSDYQVSCASTIVTETTINKTVECDTSSGSCQTLVVSFPAYTAFTNPGNVYSSDDTYATCAATSGDLVVDISKDGGNTYGTALTKTFTGTEALQTYGAGSTELWGLTCTRADVVDANFRIRVTHGTYSHVFKTFGFTTGTDTLTGIEVSIEAKYASSTISIDHIKVKIYYGTSVLPIQAGSQAFASDGRKNGEGAGSGTGVLVFHDGTAWRACDTGATVAA